MKHEVTTITIEHGKMSEEEVNQMVEEMFETMRIRFQANIVAYSHKTSNHNSLLDNDSHEEDCYEGEEIE